MRRQPRLDQGFTVYQLLVSIVVVVILGSLWMAYTNHQKLQQQQRSAVALLLHG
jgi:Tfp pilus assembly protein FimT